MKTPAEIEALKKNWLNDPCWDIEETEGFEEHKAELKEFRRLTEMNWRASEYCRVYDKARSLIYTVIKIISVYYQVGTG
jgi:hypothetical protein